MILDILIFALGFLVAGLLALAVLPAVWRRAMRLSGERLSRLVPLSPQEIAAERDHLRAAHAVELRRTEQKLERAETERAELLVEASRRESRVAALTREVARAEAAIAALTAEAAGLRHDLDALQAEAGTAMMALHDASGLADKRWSEMVDLRLENQRLADHVDRDRASVAGLETRLLGATTRADDLARDLAAALERATAPAPPAAALVDPDAGRSPRPIGSGRRGGGRAGARPGATPRDRAPDPRGRLRPRTGRLRRAPCRGVRTATSPGSRRSATRSRRSSRGSEPRRRQYPATIMTGSAPRSRRSPTT